MDNIGSSAPMSALSLHDARPFFEKSLAYGVQHGLISQDKLRAICDEAPKGMVQIARYFGSEFLRPELEKARARIVNLVSLSLEDSSGGDMDKAAQMLREHTLLSRSKAGSDMLKRLIAMPESSNLGMEGYADAQTPLLAVWSLRSHAEYRAEWARRSQVAKTMDAALWFAQEGGVDLQTLQEAGAEAEAVIRMALLMHALAPHISEWPSGPLLEKLLLAQRKKRSGVVAAALSGDAVRRWCAGLPAALHEAVQAHYPAVQADLPKLLDAALPVRTLLRPMGAFRARYFALEDPIAEVDSYFRSADELPEQHLSTPGPAAASKTWNQATQGHDDEHALLTLFTCLAAGVPKKTLLTEKTAASLVRKIRKTGWTPEEAAAFIRQHAPGAYQHGYLQMWDGFVQEAQAILCNDRDGSMQDALALLRRECHVVGG